VASRPKARSSHRSNLPVELAAMADRPEAMVRHPVVMMSHPAVMMGLQEVPACRRLAVPAYRRSWIPMFVLCRPPSRERRKRPAALV